MINVILFGTGKGSIIVKSGLKNNINIMCYCDNDKEKVGNTYNDKKIISPNDLRNVNFDYIIIASQFNDPIYEQLLCLNIDTKKIIQFFKYIDWLHNPLKTELYLVENTKYIEIISTGISYMVSAINPEFFERNIVNLANISQDLYYDYNLFKFVINKYKEKLNSLKYVFIGLSYYSFEYDMSRSYMKGKVAFYYSILGLKHNVKNVEINFEELYRNTQLANELFNLNENNDCSIDLEKQVYSQIIIDEKSAKKQATLDSNKNYPETVLENIEILKEYIKLLKEYNIVPIIVICPATKAYTNYFSEKMQNDFKNILNKITKEYNLIVWDFFKSELFNIKDFCDDTHLNSNGSIKFTKILNQRINNIISLKE